MSARTVAVRGRAFAQAQMTDQLRVVRAGRPVTDDETGQVTTPTTIVYEGAGKARPMSPSAQRGESGDAPVTQMATIVSIPFTATGIRLDDLVEFDESDDPELLAVRLRIRGVVAGSHVTARRLHCELESRR